MSVIFTSSDGLFNLFAEMAKAGKPVTDPGLLGQLNESQRVALGEITCKITPAEAHPAPADPVAA